MTSVTIKIESKEVVAHLRNILPNIKVEIARSVEEAAEVVKDNIKKELRSSNKSGTFVGEYSVRQGRRFKRFSDRRSALGESLARETGRSESLIASRRSGTNSMSVGFLENPNGFNYVAYHEIDNNRPTLENAVSKSIPKIDDIFRKNFEPKK